MRRSVTILVTLLAMVAPLFATSPIEAATPPGVWENRQVLRKGGLYHAAIDGTTAVVADWKWESGVGRVFVFTRVGGTWVWQQTLTSPDPPPPYRGDGFGFAVDVHDGVIVVGQRHPWYSHGAAHVFEYRNGRWRHEAQLTGTNGWDVTVWGDFIAASGNGSSSYPGAWGKISIYQRQASGWTHTQTFRRGRDGDVGCLFGFALDMHRDVLVAGDIYSHDPCASYAHVYRRTDSTWSLEQRLSAGYGDGPEGFVAVWGDTIAIGDPAGPPSNHAKVRIFDWNGSKWVRTQTIRRPTHSFGDAVAICGDTLIVSDATRERTWAYSRSDGTWQLVGQFRVLGTGRYVAVHGQHMISAGTGKAIAYRLNL